MANAARFTATVDAWNKASLSGDVDAAMSVTFNSTSKSSGKVMADKSAQLIVAGLPACTVKEIILYVHSNQSSGSATVAMTLANQSWLVADGDFDQWPGISGFSSATQTLSALPYQMEISKGAQLMLLIEGSANSVYLEKISVDYVLTPKQPQTLTLEWCSQDGSVHQQMLSETVAGEGVELPGILPVDSLLQFQGEQWHWIGWCRSAFDVQTESPNYWERGDGFWMESSCTLYALYTNSQVYQLRQDSSFTSGEYALCCRVEVLSDIDNVALAGSWKSSQIAMQTVPMRQDASGDWLWEVTDLADVYRYQLSFEGDSVRIYHPSSDKWIGHTNSSGNNNNTKWAWQKASQGSIQLYGAKKQTKYGVDYTELSYFLDWDNQLYYAAYHTETYSEGDSKWLLFPTDKVPSAVESEFTTFATKKPSALCSCKSVQWVGRKYLDNNGRIIIQTNQHTFTLLGQSL